MNFENEPGSIVIFYTRLAQLRVYELVANKVPPKEAGLKVLEQVRGDLTDIIKDYSGKLPKLEKKILKCVANEYGVELPEIKKYTAEQLEVLDKKLEELTYGCDNDCLMLRTVNVLKKADIIYLGDVKNRERQELLGLRGLGKIVITQFENIFKFYNLSWDENIAYARPEERAQTEQK